MYRRQAVKKLRWCINTNFKENDYHVVLTYEKDKRADTFAEMKKDALLFRRKLKYRCEKQGIEFKFIEVMEKGKRGALHLHYILPNIPPRLISDSWDKGRVHVNMLDDTGQYKDLADYLIKYTDEAVRSGEIKQRWSRSRNLKEPEIKVERIKAKKFRKEIKVPKGYYLDKNSLRQYQDAFGNMAQSYVLVQIKEPEKNNVKTRATKQTRLHSCSRRC